VTESISGQLPYDEQQSRHQFSRLPHDQQTGAIRSLAADGFGDHEIATRTGLHVEMVRRLLAEGRSDA
jgi:DNA-directed RNA polymerase specialized sigma24 family protein